MAVFDWHHSRVDNRHTEFVEYRRRMGERRMRPWRVQDGLDAVAFFLPAYVDQPDGRIRVGVSQPLGMPDDLVGTMAQEVGVIQQTPDLVDTRVRNTGRTQGFS